MESQDNTCQLSDSMTYNIGYLYMQSVSITNKVDAPLLTSSSWLGALDTTLSDENISDLLKVCGLSPNTPVSPKPPLIKPTTIFIITRNLYQ